MNYRTTVLTEIFLIITAIFLFFSYLKTKESSTLILFNIILSTAIILGIKIKFNKNDD